jgi:uncharacterized protein YehS (DUF1456 family)
MKSKKSMNEEWVRKKEWILMIKDICLLVNTICIDRTTNHSYIILILKKKEEEGFEYISTYVIFSIYDLI